ncbi:hypothetical protein B0H17DRAFT_1058072 [Mycena rosella]|uniref:Novel STAND NTPase 1 domain-containing protein n=1 Tax=Mycena rosella TaxID=1033263 RepID=A0AAD7DLM2_MYCRO|nr:hypothetical protein B0H17DRAFT_1058072 [Mycena rosella]
MSRRLEQTASWSLLDSGALNQSLLLLGQIGEAGNLAVLKGFAGVVHLVLDTCQTASSNKAESMALAQDVGQLAMAVAGQVEEHKDEIGADSELLDQISKLCLELEAVHSILKNLFQRGSFTWLVKHSQDEVKLQRLQRDIKHAIDLFSLQSTIRLQKHINRAETGDASRRARILEEIRGVCQSVMDEIKTGKQVKETPSKAMAAGPVLPRMPRHFFGRGQSIDAVATTLIATAPGRIAILGSAGIGKTSVASMVLFDARVVEYFGTHRYFISCDAAGGKDDLLTSIAGPLGLQGDKLQKKVLDALGDAEHRKIIVLDNFESPWESSESSKKEVESFLAALCALDNLAVVITMRGSERPAGVQWSRPFLPQLGPLDVPSARKAFLSLSDCLDDDPWIDPLLAAIDFVPLAVALMANLAETESTETLLLRWREGHSSLLHRTPDGMSSLDISIGISLNSPRMKAVPEAFTLLSLISLLPDGIDNTQLGVIFPSIPKSRRALSALWQTSLAYNDGHNRTRVLSPIRSHMMLYHQSNTAHRVSVLTYYMGLAGLSSDLGGPHGQAIVKRLTPEIGNLHSIVNLTLDSTGESPTIQPLLRGAITGAINLSKFIRYTHLGNPDTVRLASVAANKLGDPVLRADVLYHLAWIMLSLGTGGQNSEHERLCKEALALYEQCGNVNGRAECTWLLGQIYKGTKRQKECKALYEQALALAVEAQNAYCQAKCLSCLSEITFYAGDPLKSEVLSQQALKLFRELQNLTNIGMTLYWLGRLAAFRHDRTADVIFDEAAEVLKQAGAFPQVGRILVGKGDSAFARCDFYAAREEYIKAIALYEETGFLQAGPAGFAQLSLGTAAAYLYDYSEANHWVDAARRTFEKTPNGAYGKMHCEIIYGDLAMYEEKFEEASTFYQRALLATESLGLAEEEGQCCVKLGTLELTRGRPRLGMRHLVVAAAAQRRISDVKGLGQTLVRLGQCFAAEGDRPGALLFFRTAYPVCRKMESLRDLADCLVGIGTVCGDAGAVAEGGALYDETGDTKGRARVDLLNVRNSCM